MTQQAKQSELKQLKKQTCRSISKGPKISWFYQCPA